MIGNTETWYGLGPNGEEKMIEHSKMMDWAFDNDMQLTVGWSHAFKMEDGTRWVRGTKMLEQAKLKGWQDLADKLQSFGFTDKI